MSADRPALSVIVATLDEQAHIESFLDGILDQDLDVPYEVLVVDGGSTDATRELVEARAARSPQVRLLDNPRRRTPFAFNIGLAEARGELVAILGAHTRYPRNYLSSCVRVVDAGSGPTACGGLVRTVPAGGSLDARLACAVMGSSFASSSQSFRTQRGGEVESIPYPVYRLEDVRAVGGFDERLERNQDNDLSHRLREHGVRLMVTDETSCDYAARSGMRSLLRYAAFTGEWNGRTVRMGLAVMKPRHFAPGAFVVALAVAVLVGSTGRHPLARLARFGAAAVLLTHLALGTRSALRERDGVLRGPERLLLAPAVLAFHVAYGVGNLRGLAATPPASERD